MHGWELTPTEAIALQRELAPRVATEGAAEGARLIAACDVAFIDRRWPRQPSRARAAVVLVSYPELTVAEERTVEADTVFPYVPGLLSFREIPVLRMAFELLEAEPDLIVVDGQGLAHPRRFGIASHLGLLAGRPAIGVAKSRLCGEHAPVGGNRGSWAPLVDGGETVGAAVRTRVGVKPVYVSVGHRISLEAAVAWTLRLATRYRLPEPSRLADRLSRPGAR
jgi:deoxyribonuclease V